jgi:DNA-binding GntR family transcriptional regulator
VKRVNSDLAYDYIRGRILDGHYPPGSSLMTEVLAAKIGVSRTPVRDALRKLEADGLVSIKAHLGAQVKDMDLKEFREMCDFRLALESHAAGLAAANRNDQDLAELKFALDGMRRLTLMINKSNREKDLIDDLVREDVRFHVAVMNASKNELLKREILRLHLINRVVLGPVGVDGLGFEPEGRADRDKHRNEVIEEHEVIFDAITGSKVPAAKQAMERHLQSIIDSRLSKMAFAHSRSGARELTPEEQAYRL